MRQRSVDGTSCLRSGIASLALLGLFSTQMQAQVSTRTQARVLSVASDTGRVMVVPGDLPSMQPVMVEGVNFSIGTEGDFRVFRAVYRGETHVAHATLDGPPPHFAFDPAQARFREVSSSLLVELNDYSLLPDVVEAVGGVSGKSYEQLGFAIVQLPEVDNPAEAAETLEGHAAVSDVQVQLDSPLNVPL